MRHHLLNHEAGRVAIVVQKVILPLEGDISRDVRIRQRISSVGDGTARRRISSNSALSALIRTHFHAFRSERKRSLVRQVRSNFLDAEVRKKIPLYMHMYDNELPGFALVRAAIEKHTARLTLPPGTGQSDSRLADLTQPPHQPSSESNTQHGHIHVIRESFIR